MIFPVVMVLAALFAPGADDIGAASTRITAGACVLHTMIASGPDDQDLSRKEKPFTCDSMVTSMVDEQAGHFMFMFVDKKKPNQNPIGFAGFADDDASIKIDRVYFSPGRATEMDDGHCWMVFKGEILKTVACAAVVDEHGWKTVVSVNFQAAR